MKVVITKHYRQCLVSKCLLYDNLSISCNEPRVGYFVVKIEVIQGQLTPISRCKAFCL